MLTEAEKKWLKQKEILDEVSEACYTVGSCEDCYAKESCYLWPNDYRDAAEFEARVAAKLALTYNGPEPCERNEEVKHCPWAKRVVEGKMTCKFCRLKHARLVVEREMDEVSA